MVRLLFPYRFTGMPTLVQTLESVEHQSVKELSDSWKTVKILLSEEELQGGVNQLSKEIADCYGDNPLTIISILTGSIVLLADTIRQLSMPLRVGVVQAASYVGDQRGELTINADWMPDISGRDVLLIDDIFDTGHTLEKLVQHMEIFSPNTLRSAVLLKKTGRQQVSYEPDFVAFDIPDEFVVGYGLDFNDEYRNLPYLASLEESDLIRHRTENANS